MKKLFIPVFLFCVIGSNLFADFSDSMKARLGELVAAKDAGTIGEGVDGFVHLRDASNAVAQKLVVAENLDRKQLFASLASKTGGSVNAVAERFSHALATKSKKGHWFRKSSGNWIRK